jgi:hypothetical protein
LEHFVPKLIPFLSPASDIGINKSLPSRRVIMQKKLLVLSFLVMSSFLASCGQVSSEDVASDIIRTRYDAHYDESDGELKIKGRFSINHSTDVALDGESKFLVDGNVTKYKRDIVGQTFYEYKKFYFKNPSNKKYELTYTDKDGGRYENTITLPSKFDIEYASTVDSSQDFKVEFEVDDLTDGAQKMDAYIGDGDKSISAYEEGSLAKGQLVFKAEKLATLLGDKVYLTVCRRREYKKIDNPGAGGSMDSSYCKGVKTLKLK